MKRLNTLLCVAGLCAGLAHTVFAQSATNAPPGSPPPPATLEPATNAAANSVAAPTNATATGAATNTEPTISAEEGTNGLRMNFRGAPLNLVLDYLSDAAGFIINKTTDVRGTVEVWSKQPVTKDEAVELLSAVLKKNGYAVTRNGRILTIIAMDTAKTSSELPVVTGSDPDSIEQSDEVETRIIPVHYASATQLVPNLELLLPTSATLSANESANTLILVATKSDIKRMLKIVQALDTSIATVSTVKVRPLLYADAKDTATLITQLFTSQTQGQNGQGNRGFNFGPGGFPFGGGGFRAAMAQAAANANNRSGSSVGAHVVAVADDRSNSIVLSAPPDLMSTIEDMLKEIDRQVSDDVELRVFRLRNADPTELADQLSQLFPDENSTGNNNNQNVPFFMRGAFGNRGNTQNNNSSERARKLGKVTAVPDPRTESLIVTASKTLMPQIAEMINELDSDRGKREVVSYYELQNADPQDVYQNLQDLFNRSTVRMQNNNNQNTMLSRNNPLTQRQLQSQQSSAGANTSFTGRSTTGGGSRFGQ